MTPEIFNKMFGPQCSWKGQACAVGGRNKNYCSCGTIMCNNHGKLGHRKFWVWVPNLQYTVPGVFEEIFPAFKWSQRYGRKNQATFPQVIELTEWLDKNGIPDLLKEFCSFEYQMLLGHKRPAAYISLWYIKNNVSLNLGYRDFMLAAEEFMPKGYVKKELAKIVAGTLLRNTDTTRR